MSMYKMLPRNGIIYNYIPDYGHLRENNRRILPAHFATEIMRAFNRNVDEPTRQAFNHEISKLFINGRQQIKDLLIAKQHIPHDERFWINPALDTIFEDLIEYYDGQATYQFALKLLEGRVNYESSATITQFPDRLAASRRDSETVQALDDFKNALEDAGLTHPMLAGTAAAYMAPYMASVVVTGDERQHNPYYCSDDEDDRDNLRPGESLPTIEMDDAFEAFEKQYPEMYAEFNECYAHEEWRLMIDDFVGSSFGRGILAERAPVLKALLEGTRRPDVAEGEVTLQRKLRARAFADGTIDEDLIWDNTVRLEEQERRDETLAQSVANHLAVSGEVNCNSKDADGVSGEDTCEDNAMDID